MTTTTTVKINFENNQGSFAVDAIAHTVGGNWHDSSDNVAFVDVPTQNVPALEKLLDDDDNVTGYEER
jgi:hypothetical protein